MTRNKFTDTYRKAEVVTAKREQLLLMLYAGAIRFLKGAINASEQGNTAERTRLMGKVQEIVNELRSTLNFEAEKEIAQNLDELYLFITHRLVDANIQKKDQPLHEALKILDTLNSAWKEAISTLHESEVTKTTEAQ